MPERKIVLKKTEGRWTARDMGVEISAQGATRSEALENLDAVVEAITGDGGREPTDEELRDLGIETDPYPEADNPDKWKEPYPDDIEETTTGFPEEDVETEPIVKIDDPDAWKEPYPEDNDSHES